MESFRKLRKNTSKLFGGEKEEIQESPSTDECTTFTLTFRHLTKGDLEVMRCLLRQSNYEEFKKVFNMRKYIAAEGMFDTQIVVTAYCSGNDDIYCHIYERLTLQDQREAVKAIMKTGLPATHSFKDHLFVIQQSFVGFEC